ncbi:MAG TPA: dihydroorotate dehydrogenase electron transfer subunit [Actinoallomurus sp.]|nr:dihydroorotate dehydrogenase electron transfer subunit [Actinoallomurus sp.]
MTDSSPVQVPGTVLTMRRIGTYQTMTLVAPGVAERFRPGQFVAVAVGGEQSSMLLRRCFSVREVKPDYGGTVEIVFAVRGKGTEWLAALRPRDIVDIAGPLGRPFPLPRDPVNCVLLGVAHGSAALFPLAAVLGQRDCRLHFVLGGSSSDDVLGARGARRTGDSVAVATGDGSLGSAGSVDDLLPGVIEDAQADVVYACGPLETLRAVTRTCKGYGIPAQVAVEEPMACGTGVCMACVLPVIGDDGGTHMVRTCVEGPVFRGERVRWDDVGTIPFDALGAPRALRLGERP